MGRVVLVVLALLVLPLAGFGATLRSRLHPPRHGVQVRLSPITVAPGTEREVCQLVTLQNRRAMDTGEIKIAMSGPGYASHHFAMFIYQGDDVGDVPAEPFDRVGCVGVGDQVVSPILAFVQRTKQKIHFPAGVAIRLEPRQRLLLNAHYINTTTEPVTIDVAANFRAMPRRSVRHHARSFQLGTVRIRRAAG